MKCPFDKNYRISGIYGIINKVDSKIYIGSAVDLYSRYHGHLHHLKNNNHRNKHLQHAWNKFGQSNFNFVILSIVKDVSNLVAIEQVFMNVFYSWNRSSGYNLDPIAGSKLGAKSSDKTKKKISNSWNVNRIERGKKISRAKRDKGNKKIIQLSKDGKFIAEHMSRADANEFMGLKATDNKINECLRGRSSSSCGFKWKYKNG